MTVPKHHLLASAGAVGEPIPEARLVTTRSTHILRADLAAASLLQRSVQMMEQRPLAALVDLDGRREFGTRLPGLSEGDVIADWVLRFGAPSGRAIEVVATVRASVEAKAAEPLLYHWTLTGRPCHGCGCDTSEAMANPPTMESELHQLAHELNQPLAAIVMYARGIQLRLKAGALSDADLRDALDVVVKQALRATEIVRALDRKWGS